MFYILDTIIYFGMDFLLYECEENWVHCRRIVVSREGFSMSVTLSCDNFTRRGVVVVDDKEWENLIMSKILSSKVQVYFHNQMKTFIIMLNFHTNILFVEFIETLPTNNVDYFLFHFFHRPPYSDNFECKVGNLLFFNSIVFILLGKIRSNLWFSFSRGSDKEVSHLNVRCLLLFWIASFSQFLLFFHFQTITIVWYIQYCKRTSVREYIFGWSCS